MRIKKAALQGSNLRFDGRTVEGYAAVFGVVDYEGDVVQKGAFAKTLQENGHRVKALWQHNPDLPLGPILELKEDDYGLFFRFAISETSFGNDTLTLLRDYQAAGLEEIFPASFFAEVVNQRREKRGDRMVRVLTELKLYDISLVTFPGNESAQALALKAANGATDLPLASRDREWDANAAESRVRAWAGGEDDMDWAAYRRAFFWYDEAEPELFGSYKLPFADVIDGELTAVPRGIFAVAAALQGARGGVDIPEEDVAAVRRRVAAYYRRMAEEFDDEALVPPWEVEAGRRWHTVQKEFLPDGSVVLRLGESLRASLYETLDWQASWWLGQGIISEDVFQALRRAADEAVGVVLAAVPEDVQQRPLSVIPDWLAWVTAGLRETVTIKARQQRGDDDAGRAGPGESVPPTHPTREELLERLNRLKQRFSEVQL